MKNPPKILRTLHLVGAEKLYCLHGGWMIIGYAAHLTGDPTMLVNNIPYAIPHLLKRHPRMRTQIRIDNNEHFLDVFDYDEDYFEPRLFYSIRDASDRTWEQVVDEECNRNPYINQGSLAFPLFHFIVVLNQSSLSSNENQSFHLLLFSHHSASDGRSGFILINDLLTLVIADDCQHHLEPVNRAIIPVLINFIPRPYGPFYHLMSMVAKRFFKRELRELHHPRIPVKAILLPDQSSQYSLQPMKTHFLFTSTSSTLYSRLHDRCQREHVTLHGPLLACLLLAIQHCFPVQHDDQRYLNVLNVDLDFDLRSRLPRSPLTPTTVGFCVGIAPITFKHRFPLRSTAFWRLARKCVSATNKTISNREVHFFQHVLRDILDNERTFNKLIRHAPHGRLSEVNFSNIGKYPFSNEYRQGQLRLQGLHKVNNGSTYRTSTILFVTCSGAGSLDVSLAHEMETEIKAKGFLDDYVRLLEICADDDKNATLQDLLDKLKS